MPPLNKHYPFLSPQPSLQSPLLPLLIKISLPERWCSSVSKAFKPHSGHQLLFAHEASGKKKKTHKSSHTENQERFHSEAAWKPKQCQMSFLRPKSNTDLETWEQTGEEQMATWTRAWILGGGGNPAGLSSRKLINFLRLKKKKVGLTLWGLGFILETCDVCTSGRVCLPGTAQPQHHLTWLPQTPGRLLTSSTRSAKRTTWRKVPGSSAFWRCCCCQWDHSLLTQYATCTWTPLDGFNG